MSDFDPKSPEGRIWSVLILVYGRGRSDGARLGDRFTQEEFSERYGIRAWARDPYGGYGDADFIVARVKELKAAVAAAAVARPEESSRGR